MSKKIDPDVLAVKRCVKALMAQTPRMRRVTLEYLWARFVTDDAAKQAKANQ